MAFESIITVSRDKCKHVIIGSICRTVGYPKQETKLLTIKKVLETRHRPMENWGGGGRSDF